MDQENSLFDRVIAGDRIQDVRDLEIARVIHKYPLFPLQGLIIEWESTGNRSWPNAKQINQHFVLCPKL